MYNQQLIKRIKGATEEEVKEQWKWSVLPLFASRYNSIAIATNPSNVKGREEALNNEERKFAVEGKLKKLFLGEEGEEEEEEKKKEKKERNEKKRKDRDEDQDGMEEEEEEDEDEEDDEEDVEDEDGDD